MVESQILDEAILAEVRRLCIVYGVASLAVFGSALTARFNPARSDLDLLVRFRPTRERNQADQYFGLKETLEDLLGRPVDLVVAEAVRNPYFLRELDETAREIYAA